VLRMNGNGSAAPVRPRCLSYRCWYRQQAANRIAETLLTPGPPC
jgi:hypothetical protein